VRESFPETIVLKGAGGLYWTGAIELGMRYAMEHGAECIVWLNDDSLVSDGSIKRLVHVAKDTRGIASALGYVNMHTIGKKWYFPAQYRSQTALISHEILPHSGIVATDACRGNLVAISRDVIEKIGYPDGKGIPHIAGDSDYSLRASKAGIPCNIVTDVLLEEVDSIKNNIDSWLLGETKLSVHWERILTKRSSYYPPMRWTYLKRHWGWRGILQYPSPYVRLAIITLHRIIIPRKMLISIYGTHSNAWKSAAWTRR
jgi:GT2 family glycosyltransferase